MPWTATDAPRHTARADTPELRDLWARVANERLEAGVGDAAAIREANAVVAREARHSRPGQAAERRVGHRWV